MTLVDTSVWIDFLEGGNHWTKERLKRLIEDRESIVYTHMILLEIIQGLREKKDRKKIE
ncbi:MAG: PIN domain-containing protein, partial [Verrucomicrobiae bacterium]|nr:PIN domain-containing protein [Verrucomicrobiae bacterium]